MFIWGDLFSRANFSNLKELELRCDYDTNGRALIHDLEMIADSLTHLIISDCRWNSLREILEACPNLVSLTATEVGIGLPSMSSFCCPKMTHLTLVYRPDPDFPDDDQTLDFISGFPSLLSLEIYPMRDARLLTVLHNLCPSLQMLYYGGRKEDGTKVDVQPNREGLTLAHLCGDAIYQRHDLIQFFHLRQKTLETIYCDVYIIEDDDAPWGLLHGRVVQMGSQRHDASLGLKEDPTQSEISFERLVELEFISLDPSTSKAFNTWFISNAPNLKSISVIDSCLPLNIANAMINLKSLSRLKITSWKEDLGGIKQFLEHHVAVGNQSTLEEIEINLVKEISKVTWLPLVSGLQCLKSLKWFPMGIPTDCISTIAEISQGCLALEKLSIALWCVDFPQGILKSLCELPNLKWLRIEAGSICESDLGLLDYIPKSARTLSLLQGSRSY